MYLQASEDGHHWTTLESKKEIVAYTGRSGRAGWIRQTVDISEFAGRRVILSFKLVTDSAGTGEGFLVDDISIPEVGYSTDFESGDGGWEADSFLRVNNAVPQSFRAAIIRMGDSPVIEQLSLDRSNHASISLDAGEEAVLVVMGTARLTRQPANYALSFSH